MKKIWQRKENLPEKPKPVHTPGPCLNCGTFLDSQYQFCPQCGQKQLEKEDLSFHHMIGESFLDYFHFDSKFFRTLRPLLFSPGYLTMEYMKGKRKSFVEPFKLFLVISVIYFLLLPLSKDTSSEPAQVKNGRKNAKTEKVHITDIGFSVQGKPITVAQQDSIRHEVDSTGLKAYVDKHFKKENQAMRLLLRQAYKILVYSGLSFITVLEHTASKMIFLLIPVFALLLKLCFLRSRRLYLEHLVFSLHIHSFIFILLIVKLLVGFFFQLPFVIPLLMILLYMFLSIKRNYAKSVGKTLWNLFLLIIFYGIVALPVFFLLLIIVAVFIA